MNREIKFRAWFPSEGKMYIWEDFKSYRLEKAFSLEDDGDPKIAMQYTGLKDKNGKEIYEGDIAKTGNGRLWIVSFGNYQYYQDTPAVGFYLWSKLSVFPLYGRIEIIGNVHENPEML